MGEKRRDSKGRVLRMGEQQRSDGRYIFTYRDVSGKQRYAYSWKLEPTDKMPAGKKFDLSLREKEKEIEKDLRDEVAHNGGNLTVVELVEKYIGLKTGVRASTKAGYKTVIGILKKEEFGSRRIDTVRLSDAKTFLVKLQKEDGRSYSSIHSIRGVLRPAFQMAMDDDLIRKNPFQFELATVIVNDSLTREAVTRKQERQFLEFLKEDKHFSRYYDTIFILFKTGMRISEYCGLTLKDVNMKDRTINIDHQLQRTSEMEYIIELPKTDAGVRKIPMSDEVYECFKRIIKKRRKPKVEPSFSDRNGKMYCGFLILDKNGMPEVALHWEKHFEWALAKYNRIYREPLPKITPHVCRHTYCSNMAKSGMNPKTLQYLMGHSDISVTLNTYTHINFDDVKEEIKRMAGNE